MKPLEAEKLLGGHATGTLTEAERRLLFAAALEHQDIFDALMDEEALRELLADPAAKAQLIAELGSSVRPNVVPFWRHPGVLGAAASLLVASLAGIAYLRSPNALLPAQHSEARMGTAAKVPEAPATKTTAAPAMKGAEVLGGGTAPGLLARKSAPEPAKEAAKEVAKDADLQSLEAVASVPSAASPNPQEVAAAASALAREEVAHLHEKGDYRQVVTHYQRAKQAEEPRSDDLAEKVSARLDATTAQKSAAQDKPAGGVHTRVIGEVVGGPDGGLAAPSSPAKARVANGFAQQAALPPAAPVWTLEVQPDGRTRVTVSAPRGRTVTLLRRASAGVEVLPVHLLEDRGQALVQWRAHVRLGTGDALDLYLLAVPAADPARLPETGPLNGTRVRIYPAMK